ncbi:Phage tail fiber protein [Myxococcus hansupus]|uniref:Phage tail fiber protein n=1 Tax=Pseudomyxococcus hansupus TaxID=1297742 RepID=A0A0H4WSY9_9BACT|nr:tail fiber domain-containing protein [Myxococcus hansupus]AKQ66601.1 Phage tail fiber protein [Myxococcus hansupus]
MTDPFIKANPGDPILSEHWNTLQVRLIEAIRTHTHLGGTDGTKLKGGGLDPETTLTVKELAASSSVTAKQVDVSGMLTVKGINVADRITGLDNEKFPVTGGRLSGPITVAGHIGIGTTDPQTTLHVVSPSNIVARIEAGGTGSWAELDLYSTFNAANQRRWNLAACGHGGFLIRLLSDVRGEQSIPLSISPTGGTVTLKNLAVQGNIIPSVGNSMSSGIQFPTDPGGGSGDQAFIRYFVTGGETTKLRIGIDNDVDDTLGLWQMGSERLTVYNGNVGIGTEVPQTALHIKQRVPGLGIRLEDIQAHRCFQIHYENNNATVVFYHENGLGHFMRNDGSWNRNSDASLKENVAELEGTLDKILQLKPSSFDWKGTGTRDIGLVAQDVEKLFPELVGTVQLDQAPEPKTIKGIDYSNLGVLAIAAIQELKARYDATLKELEARIQTLSKASHP